MILQKYSHYYFQYYLIVFQSLPYRFIKTIVNEIVAQNKLRKAALINYCGMNFKASPLLQYLLPVGNGPSLKTWP